MKISIITVVYNRASTIERAIRSVNEQIYSNVEHIVIDGGSTDGTLELIKGAVGENAFILSEPDRGIYDAINKGLKFASGDVVGFMHSDDFFPTNEILSEIAESFNDESIDAIYGDAAFFAPGAVHRVVRYYSSKRFTPERLQNGWMPAHTSLFLRRDVYKKYGGYKIDYRIAADFEFICRIFNGGNLRARYLPKALVKMQTGGQSAAGLRSTLILNREVMRALRENNMPANWLRILSRYPNKLIELL